MEKFYVITCDNGDMRVGCFNSHGEVLDYAESVNAEHGFTIYEYEIYTALIIIKTVCEESTCCSICPLKSPNPNFSGGLKTAPTLWKIKEYNEYHAFQ